MTPSLLTMMSNRLFTITSDFFRSTNRSIDDDDRKKASDNGPQSQRSHARLLLGDGQGGWPSANGVTNLD